MLFNELLKTADSRSPSAFGSPGPWAAAWFAPPLPFGKDNAMLPVDKVASGAPYPIFIFIDEYGTIYMWCLSILLQRCRWWRVHPSRITIVAWYGTGPIRVQPQAKL